jgi:hypothetical protein
MAEKSHGSSRASHVLGGKGKSKSKSGGKKPHEIHIRRGHKGGFIVRHSHKPDPDTGVTPEEEENPISDVNSLHSHIDDTMGDQPPMPAAPTPDAASAGASSAVAPPPPGM